MLLNYTCAAELMMENNKVHLTAAVNRKLFNRKTNEFDIKFAMNFFSDYRFQCHRVINVARA